MTVSLYLRIRTRQGTYRYAPAASARGRLLKPIVRQSRGSLLALGVAVIARKLTLVDNRLATQLPARSRCILWRAGVPKVRKSSAGIRTVGGCVAGVSARKNCVFRNGPAGTGSCAYSGELNPPTSRTSAMTHDRRIMLYGGNRRLLRLCPPLLVGIIIANRRWAELNCSNDATLRYPA